MTIHTLAMFSTFAILLGGLLATGSKAEATGEGVSTDRGAPDPLAYHERRREAQAHYAAGDFARAAVLYQKLAEANREDGDNWLRLARCRSQRKEHRQAIEAFRRASELGFGHLQRNYRDIARAYARLGEKENAL